MKSRATWILTIMSIVLLGILPLVSPAQYVKCEALAKNKSKQSECYQAYKLVQAYRTLVTSANPEKADATTKSYIDIRDDLDSQLEKPGPQYATVAAEAITRISDYAENQRTKAPPAGCSTSAQAGGANTGGTPSGGANPGKDGEPIFGKLIHFDPSRLLAIAVAVVFCGLLICFFAQQRLRRKTDQLIAALLDAGVLYEG